jgi:hypothetical protein
MSNYKPTEYDLKLEELIQKLGDSIQFQLETNQDARASIERQKTLISARSPDFEMSNYKPTEYDLKLEDLIQKLGDSIQFQLETNQDARASIERQKTLISARSPDFVWNLEIIRGLV